MSDEEKELENLDAEDVADMSSLADFVELDDLESLEGMEEFMDSADTENVSDLDEVPANVDASALQTDSVTDEIPLPDIDIAEDETPMPDMDLAGEETALPDIDSTEDEVPLPDMDSAEEETALPDMDSAEEEIPIPDMDSAEEETALPDMDGVQDEVPPSELDEMTEKLADADGDAPLLFAEDEELEKAEAVSNDVDTPDVAVPLDEADVALDETGADMALEETAADMALDEAAADMALDDAEMASDEVDVDALIDDAEEPVVLDGLDDADMALDETDALDESDAAGMDLLPDVDALDEGAGDAVSEDGDGALDSMLDGLLDDLDMTGSLEEENETAAEESEAAPDVESADLFDVLGNSEEEGNDEVSEDLFDVAIPDIDEEEAQQEEKEPGLLKRLFGNIVTDEIAEAERKAMEEEEAKAAEKAELDEQKKEEKEQAKADAAAEKEAKKAAKAEEKAAKKAAKQAKKEEKKAQREEEEAAELEITGKLNKVGVAIIAVLTILFLSVEIIGTNLYGYSSTKKQANKYFEMGKYEQAYQEVMGTSIKEKDPETYNKIRTVMQVQRAIDSYNNYNEMNYYPEALNALVRGIQRYDTNLERAKELEVVSQMDGCKEQILSLLQSEFGVSEAEARSLLALEKEQYTRQVVDIAMKQN